MFLAFQDPKPFFVTLTPEASHSTSLLDVFVGSLGLTGLMLLSAVAAGALVAVLLVRRRRRHPAEADRLPSVTPPTPLSNSRPSSPVQ